MPESKPTPSPDGAPKTCPECRGRGWVDNRCLTEHLAHKCNHCDGRGASTAGTECPACHGTGTIEVRKEDKNPCPLCSGAGVYPVPSSMRMSDFAYRSGMGKK